MSIKKRTSLLLPLMLVLLILPISDVLSAGSVITGKVTDPKGAAIVGATVTVTDTVSNQTFTATTNNEGQYRVEGLSSGIFSVQVSADGFNEGRKDSVKLSDDVTVQIDLKLEIATVEAAVTVQTSTKGNSNPLYQSLRVQAKSAQDFAGPYATVRELSLPRDGAVFTLHSGEIYFLPPVEGRTTGAVFLGDGEITLVPPSEVEKRSLKLFTGEPQLVEKFSSLVLRFTDKTFEEIKTVATMGTGGPQAGKAHDLFHDNQQLVRKQLRDNRELRVLQDLYNPQRRGFFSAFINGHRFSKLVFVDDPFSIPEVAPEEVALFSYGDTDGGLWTAFHRPAEYKNGTASSDEDHRVIDITHHELDGVISGTTLTATDRISFNCLVAGTRVIPLSLFRSLRVNRVADVSGRDLEFIQEGKDEDSDFGVILPEGLDKGKSYQLVVSYAGNGALRDSGGGNFILLPRSTWYPGNAGTQFSEDRAIFDLTFHYPKGYTFVATGSPVGTETRDGDQTVSQWSSGTIELSVAGFNYGRFKKKEVDDKDTDYKIQFFGNEELPDEVRGRPTMGSLSTTGMANSVLADAQNSTRIYNQYFGKLPYDRIAMTQQPAGFFGQAWPTLIYMPYFAFMDSTQRYMLFGSRGATDNFWEYVAPHEIAHQWWGHTIGWSSYHDQWMSEGFAEFSASLYVQMIKGNDKFIEFWNDQRNLITQPRPATKDRKPFTVGPVTQGYRLNSGKTGGVARYLIYPKGAYILHMLRMMMQEGNSDAQFQAMMKDFVQTFYNKDVSTEDFKWLVEKHMTPQMNVEKNGRMDWFFNAFVYGTDVPSYKFDYRINSDGSLSAKITQAGVADDFTMLVPVYVDLGKGWVKLGAGPVRGNNSLELNNIKASGPIKRAAICVMNDVLVTGIETNNKWQKN
jgi:hypothetical protein